MSVDTLNNRPKKNRPWYRKNKIEFDEEIITKEAAQKLIQEDAITAITKSKTKQNGYHDFTTNINKTAALLHSEHDVSNLIANVGTAIENGSLDDSHRKKKKKHKKQLQEEMQADNVHCDGATLNNYIRDDNKQKKMKKYRKHQQASKVELTQSSDDIEVTLDVGQQKKRKKRKSDRKPTELEDTLHIDDAGVTVDDGQRKKKKKPMSNDQQIEVEGMPNTNKIGTTIDDIQQKKKKKPKKLLQEETEVAQPEDAEDAQAIDEVDPSKPEVKKKESIRARKRKRYLKLLEEQKLKGELSMQQKCLSYLSLWKHSKASWKFEKLKQIWLQQNMYDDAKIPEEFWANLIEYFSNSKGKVKETILKDALKIVESEEAAKEENKNTKYNRARELVQNLEE